MQHLDANLNNFKRLREIFRSRLNQKTINNKVFSVFNETNLSDLEQYLTSTHSMIDFIANKYLNISTQQALTMSVKDILDILNKKDVISQFFSKDPFENYVFIDLSNIYFKDSVLIYSQRSMPTISFSNSIFANDVTFQGAFAGNSYFIDTTFNQKANFQGSVFRQKADFSNSKIDLGFFDSARFDKAIIFNNTYFNHLPHFNDTNFQNRKETSFSNIKYGKEAEKDHLGVCLLYKNELKKLGDYVEENKVFAIEQKIRLNKDIENFWVSKNLTLVPNILISSIYASISNYGESTLKPVIIWISAWIIFGLLFSCNAVDINPSLTGHSLWVDKVWLGLAYSGQSITNPFSHFNTDVPFYPKNSWVAFWAHAESILGIAIITLWIFALKRRFQKGE